MVGHRVGANEALEGRNGTDFFLAALAVCGVSGAGIKPMPQQQPKP